MIAELILAFFVGMFVGVGIIIFLALRVGGSDNNGEK